MIEAPPHRIGLGGIAQWHFRVLVLLCISVAAAFSQEVGGEWKAYLRGVGPLRIGMSIGDVRALVGEPDAFLVQALRQRPQMPREPDDTACGYLVSSALPDGIDLMFKFGRLERIDVRAGPTATASGAKIGDSESRILEIYGERIVVRQSHYPPAGAHEMIYVPVDAADSEYSLLFGTDGSVVTGFRVGTKSAVEAAESCA